MTQYAVVGDPIAHSKSPEIHRLFAEQTGEDVQYDKFRVEADAFDSFVTEFFAAGGGGLNVTLPHKQAAFDLARKKSRQTDLAKAANTLWMNSDGDLQAENTDGAGLVNDLQKNNQFSIADKHILLLGAGGAARGALAALVAENPASILVLNRTLARAEALQSDFASTFELQTAAYDATPGQQYELVVNATAMSIAGEVPAISPDFLAPGCCCYDMMYGADNTAFMRWAEQQGAGLVLDGLGMLVEQAAESFYIWRGVKPQTADVIAALR
jgi:shikimate dehydrogenase